MKKLLPLLIIAFSISAFGQVTVDQLQAKAKEIKAKDITFEYDKYKDRSVVATKPVNLIGGMEGGAAIVFGGAGTKTAVVLMLNAVAVFKGNSLAATPERFGLLFDSRSKGWLYEKGDRNLYVLYDDKRLELHPVGIDGDLHFGWMSRDTPVNEMLMFEISPADLAAVSQAKEVSIKLGEKPRKIKGDVLERFQKFIQLMTIN